MYEDFNFDLLRNAPMLGLDIETYDPDLKKLGPGTHRGKGYICGVSFSTEDEAVYLDVAHPDTSAETKERSLKIIADLCGREMPKVGANLIYDLEWLTHERIKVRGDYDDVQLAEPLLNEYRSSYSLEALANIYGKEAKASKILEDYCAEQGWPVTKSTPAQSYIYKMPADVVRRYAELDATLAVQIFKDQKVELERQGLDYIYSVERGLTPLLLAMRRNGVRLNLNLYRRTALAAADRLFETQKALYEWAGCEFNIGSTHQLAKLFDQKGIPYPRKEPTDLMLAAGKPGNPNIDKNTLLELSSKGHDIAAKILQYRHYDTLSNMFMLPYLDFLVKDRLYCQFHPLRSDDYGAVSGRFSCSKPNLQQVPAQEDEKFSDNNPLLQGLVVRKLFIPEEDHIWAKLDYSQVEYRITAHYALGPGSEELREAYRTNPKTDYHKRIQDLTGFDRRSAKRLNFGAGYGMGVNKAAELFGWTLEEAEMFMEGYHRAAPYLRTTRRAVVEKAERTGFIYTLLGRRARVSPTRKLHSLFNRLIQGSAADVMKKALVDAWNVGVFDILVPHITVHDEVDVSVPQTTEGNEALMELKRVMEECVELRVPLIADCHTAENWGEAD